MVKQSVEAIVLFICYVLNVLVPKRGKQIFFYSTPDYSDSARTLYEELIKEGLGKSYRIVWSVRDEKRFKQSLKPSLVVRHRSLRSLWHYCRSKYIIRTHSLWGNRYVKGRQVMCVAWHGMPLKSLTRVGDKPVKVKCDYLTTTSPVFDNEFVSSMGIPIEACVHTGLPRNDELFNSGNELELMFPGFSKRIIWMPTFRQGTGYQDGSVSDSGIPCMDEGNLLLLNEELKALGYLLIVKLHPWVASRYNELSFSNIVELRDSDLPSGLSLYRLLGQTDALITDYSSVYIDYLLVDNPLCFVFDDLEEYRNSRGLAFEPIEDYLPGPIVSNAPDLINWLRTLDQTDLYSSERERIRKVFHANADANSTQRVIDVLGLF